MNITGSVNCQEFLAMPEVVSERLWILSSLESDFQRLYVGTDEKQEEGVVRNVYALWSRVTCVVLV